MQLNLSGQSSELLSEAEISNERSCLSFVAAFGVLCCFLITFSREGDVKADS